MIYFSEYDWLERLIGTDEEEPGTLTKAVEEFSYEIGILEDAKQSLLEQGKHVDNLTDRINVYRREDILSFLSRKNVLPKNRFPVDTVELRVFSPTERSRLGLELQRDLSMAISEYAPGSEVVANGRLITSRYIRKMPRMNWKMYDYIRCDCKTLNIAAHTGTQQTLEVCKGCGQPLASHVNPDDSEEILTLFCKKYEEETGKDFGVNLQNFGLYKYLKLKSAVFSDIVIAIMLFMAAVILVAAVIMIRFRISGDIQDQMQSIGVLEALGYTSKEIALSYTAEYLITAAAGVLIGAGAAFALLPVLHKTAETLSGHHGSMLFYPLPILLTGILLLVLVGLTAHFRALTVKKYPPVQAFRKGIAVHHFGRNCFPLKNTRKSVHLRIAMNGFFGNMKQNISLTVCIAVSTLAAVSGIILIGMFGSGMKVAERLTGTEMSDLTVTIMPSADINELAENISAMQGVKRVQKGSFSLDLSTWQTVSAFDRQIIFIPISYSDFTMCENIHAVNGRLPEHENEVAVTKLLATQFGLKTGDNITLESNRVKKNYIICGIVPSVSCNGCNLYLTEQAFKRIKPTYRPTAIEIYLEDNTDIKEFQTQLMQTYGRSVADTRQSDSEGTTQEQRLREEADRLLAEYIANHGANHIEYSIQIGDKTVSGTSDNFAIKNTQNIGRIMRTQIGGIFGAVSLMSWGLMGISAIVSAVIIIALMEQAVRRQRKELGIMLGLGYTTKELMLQLALRIMPAVIFAVIIGALGAITVFHIIVDFLLGATAINGFMVAAAVVTMMLFCFGCAYLGAGRIRRISVTELMTE